MLTSSTACCFSLALILWQETFLIRTRLLSHFLTPAQISASQLLILSWIRYSSFITTYFQNQTLKQSFMACSKYQYVKKFQETSTALLHTYIVVRVDGRAFTKFCAAHHFEKPNDLRAINLMNAAAEYVCSSFKDIFLAYGQSDEYSFAFNKQTTLFSRRSDKILSCLVSAFTSAYVFNWGKYFKEEMKQIPTFDSRIVLYPNEKCLKDYFRWRQVDCHINNLYNTTFWCLVKTGKSHQEVEHYLKDTNSGNKNELLFKQFNINYNKIEQIYRRGTFFLYVWEDIREQKQAKEIKMEKTKRQDQKEKVYVRPVLEIPHETTPDCQTDNMKKFKPKMRRRLQTSHEDCIRQQFWSAFDLDG